MLLRVFRVNLRIPDERIGLQEFCVLLYLLEQFWAHISDQHVREFRVKRAEQDLIFHFSQEANASLVSGIDNVLDFSESFAVGRLLLLLALLLHLEKNLTAMDGSILIVSLELKEVGTLPRFDDLLTIMLHLELALQVSDRFFSAFILLVLLWVRRLNPVSVILLLIVSLYDGLLNQVFSRLPQV